MCIQERSEKKISGPFSMAQHGKKKQLSFSDGKKNSSAEEKARLFLPMEKKARLFLPTEKKIFL